MKRWLFVFELLVLLLYMVTAVSNEVFVVHIPSLPCFFITIEILKIISSFHPYISLFSLFLLFGQSETPFPAKIQFSELH